MKTLICSCNRTMPLDAAALERLLTTAPTPGADSASVEAHHTTLCRREAPAFQRAAKSGEDLVIACTQEQRLFVELNEQTVGAPSLEQRPIRFVNIRETGGWSKDARDATPKIAALLAAAQLPPPDPVSTVAYESAGRCLVLGPADAAQRAAALLGPGVQVTVLADSGQGEVAQRRDHVVHRGVLDALKGRLGRFEATWTSNNPIDPDLCTRCNACIAACPEGAIDFTYAVDLARCKSHRDCVAVCDAAGAIDFARAPQTTSETFDLVLDLRAQPHFTQHALPQGYVHVDPIQERRFVDATLALRDLVGTFDKPKFFDYKPRLCAHSRNERVGCTACIDVCSARAISSEASLKGRAQGKPRGTTQATPKAGGQGGGIVVDPHLCVGCGACTTVCPTGALAYAAPNTVDHGTRIRTLLSTYLRAGGRDAALLLHSEGAGARVIDDLGRAASVGRGPGRTVIHGVPARVIPLAVWHTASVGIDLWLSAIAQGASQVWVLLTDEEAPEYAQALAEQMAQAQAILHGLGYAGTHLRLLEAKDARNHAALDAALRNAPAQGVAKAATFAAQADKRVTLEMALEHLMKHAPALNAASDVRPPPDAITLPAAGALYGSLDIDRERCTMCLACVGACPASALVDNPDRPQLRFVEMNCVQCGLCVGTCPEDALRLAPRLLLADAGQARRRLRVINEAEPAACIQCGKPFGTLRAVEAMIAKIGHHPAFAGDGARRLRMCNDCRVVAMFTNPNETRITDL